MSNSVKLWPDCLVSPSPTVRAWLLIGLVLLPFILCIPGLRAYHTGEVWGGLRPKPFYETLGTPAGEREFRPDFFRPLANMIVSVEYKIFGTNPILPRAIQFATYAAACLLVFWILHASSGNFLVAFLGGLIFAVMPSHVEPVFLIVHMWLNAGVFALLAFWLAGPSYCRRASWVKVLFASLAYAAGLLCYPYALLTPLFLLAYELLWGVKQGASAVRKRLTKAHLPLWVISAAFLLVTYDQLRSQSSLYVANIKSLSVKELAMGLLPSIYAGVAPLQLSPLLGLGLVFLLYFGFKRDWRFTLFLLLWTIVGPALSYADPVHVLSHRSFLASLGEAGLLSYALVSCLGAILDARGQTGSRRVLISILDWAAVSATVYWVAEILRLGWAGFFHQEGLTHHLRFYAAPLAIVSVAVRCAISRSPLPRLSKAPLRFLSAGLLALLLITYVAAFLHLFTFFINEADDIERIPRALLAAEPEVPDDSLILIVFNDDVPLQQERHLFLYFSGPIWGEYGNRAQSLPFKMWVDAYQHQTIPSDNPIVAFRFDGKKAVRYPSLEARILARQRSYLGLSTDVIHATAVASEPNAPALLLTPNVDSMLIDCAQLLIAGPADEAAVRFELLSHGRTTVLEFPANVQGEKATVSLDRYPEWLLAGELGELRITVRANGRSVPIREASLIQTRELISAEPLRLPEPGPNPDTIVYMQTGIFFPTEDYKQVIVLP